MKNSKKSIIAIIAVLLVAICIVVVVVMSKKDSKSETKVDQAVETTESAKETDVNTEANTETNAESGEDGKIIAISEMMEDAVAKKDVILTFSENEDFSDAIEDVIVNGKSVAFEKTSGTITIPGDCFKFPVEYTIQVVAGKYDTSLVYQKVLEEPTWEIAWNDEFEGDSLDTSKWDYQIGTGAEYGLTNWGNDEAEYYAKENVSVGNGVLTLEAIPDVTTYADAGTSYTSGRIRTYSDDTGSLFSTTYGRIEAKIKLPLGDGFWPAFWMLPATDTYTTWAASGEIDIMEAKGRIPNEATSALHYGEVWPNNKYSGSAYSFGTETTINEYHVYTLEWDIDTITWYVDGNQYFQTGKWFSKGADEPADYTYPAPYDEPFYILLNLAVGGAFDGFTEPSEEDFPATMDVDYVRVYKKIGGYDASQAKAEQADTASFESYEVYEDGNFITDSVFKSLNEDALTTASMDPASKQWYFLTISDYSGVATLAKEVVDDTTYAGIDVTEVGNQNYSVQLIQHMPVANGYAYTISFDAYASKEREIVVKMSGDGDNGWSVYSSAYSTQLTTEPQHFEYTFSMSAASDPTARLEFNLGLDDGLVSIGNVAVKASSGGNVDPDKIKEPLVSGNYIYNGLFNQGSDRIAFWHLEAGEGSGVNTDKAMVINPVDGGEALLYQTGILLKASADYTLSFTGAADTGTEITAQITDVNGKTIYAVGNFVVSAETKTSLAFKMSDKVPEEGVTVTFRIGDTAVRMKDISLVN